MKLHIVTPCTRPDNLVKICESINVQSEWWVVFDADNIPYKYAKELRYNELVWIHFMAVKGGVSGNLQRNYALNHITDGWVYFLDDDNLLHPGFKELTFAEVFELKPEISGVVFGQQLETSIRKPDIRPCRIDQAQFLLKRGLIKNERYLQKYEADGLFITKLYEANKDKFLILDTPLSYYNKLKWN